MNILALRDVNTVFGWEETEDKPHVVIKGQKITRFSGLEDQIRKINAQLSNFSEGLWYNIHVRSR